MVGWCQMRYIYPMQFIEAITFISFLECILVASVVCVTIIFTYRSAYKHIPFFSKGCFYILLINMISLYIFLKMVESISSGGLVTHIDVWLNQLVTTWWLPHTIMVMTFITNIASPVHLTLLSLFLSLIFLVKRKWYSLVLLMSAMTGGLLFETGVKVLIHRARPLNALIEESTYSFPSGHATMSTLFFLIVLIAFVRGIKNKTLRIVFATLCIFSFLIVGFSRIYLNVHWFSDVIAGFALGIFLVTLLVLIFGLVTPYISKRFQRITDFARKNLH